MPRVWTAEEREAQRQRILQNGWSNETNRKRANSLRGRSISNEQRASMYASRLYGTDRSQPEWTDAYEDRLAHLQSVEEFVAELEMGNIEIDPETPLFNRIRNRVTRRVVDVDALKVYLEDRPELFAAIIEGTSTAQPAV